MSYSNSKVRAAAPVNKAGASRATAVAAKTSRGQARGDGALDEAQAATGAGPSGGDVDLGPLRAYIGYSLRRAQIAVFENFMRTVGAVGLRPGQFSALLVIDGAPGLKQTTVAEALGVQNANFVSMVNELESRGLVERRAHDRRSHALFITPAGKALLAQALAKQDDHEKQLERVLGTGGRAQLVALLERICAAHDAGDI